MSTNSDHTTSDAELLAAVAEGDPEAFAALYDQHAPWLLVRLRQRTDSSDLADQVAQETFLLADPGTARFGPPAVVTSRPFDPARSGVQSKHGAWWIGDYQGLVSAAGTVHPFWNDPRTGRLEIFTEQIPTSRGTPSP